MILLPAVVEAVSDEKTLVCGAGGFCDGKTLAAALVLGADGAQMGTRFLATQESDFHQIWKEGVVAAGDRGCPRTSPGAGRWDLGIRRPAARRPCASRRGGRFEI